MSENIEECTHDCSTCSANCSSRDSAPADLTEKLNKYSSVKKVIGVVSGKGGVGKSLVTSMLAVTFSRNGYHTAVLDADITGPSIPKAFGIKERAMGSEQGILPVKTRATRIYNIVQKPNVPTIAIGKSFCGFFVSSLNFSICGVVL